jgi:hypothetical protein
VCVSLYTLRKALGFYGVFLYYGVHFGYWQEGKRPSHKVCYPMSLLPSQSVCSTCAITTPPTQKRESSTDLMPYSPAASKPLPRWTEASAGLPLIGEATPAAPSLYPYSTQTRPCPALEEVPPSVLKGFVEDGLALTRWLVEGCMALFWPPEPSRVSPRVFLRPAPFRTYFNRQSSGKQSLDVLYEDRCMNLLSEIPEHIDPVDTATSGAQGAVPDEEGAVIVHQRLIHPLLATLPPALQALDPPLMQLSDEDLYQSTWVAHLAEQNQFLNRSIERLTARGAVVE